MGVTCREVLPQQMWPDEFLKRFGRVRIATPVQEALQIVLRASPPDVDLPEPLLVEKSVQPGAARGQTCIDPHVVARRFPLVKESPVGLVLLDLRTPDIDNPAHIHRHRRFQDPDIRFQFTQHRNDLPVAIDKLIRRLVEHPLQPLPFPPVLLHHGDDLQGHLRNHPLALLRDGVDFQPVGCADAQEHVARRPAPAVHKRSTTDSPEPGLEEDPDVPLERITTECRDTACAVECEEFLPAEPECILPALCHHVCILREHCPEGLTPLLDAVSAAYVVVIVPVDVGNGGSGRRRNRGVMHDHDKFQMLDPIADAETDAVHVLPRGHGRIDRHFHPERHGRGVGRNR